MFDETPGRGPVVVHHAYPEHWDQVRLVAYLREPGRGGMPVIARGESVVRAMRAQAAAVERYAADLERFMEAGWSLSLRLGRSFVERGIDDAGDAERVVHACGLFLRGQPIEIWVADEGEAICGGGVLAGCEGHPDLYPPRTFPALIVVGYSGAQRVVESVDELRRAVSEAVEGLAAWLDRKPALVRELGADVPRTVHDVAREVAGGADVPRAVYVNLGQADTLEPQAIVEVCPVAAAIWTGVVEKREGHSRVLMATPYTGQPTGIALGLLQRGEEIATELTA